MAKKPAFLTPAADRKQDAAMKKTIEKDIKKGDAKMKPKKK